MCMELITKVGWQAHFYFYTYIISTANNLNQNKVVMESDTRTIQVQRTRTLKDGTLKTYTVERTYTVKGYPKSDGTRKLNKLTEEQKDEIKQKHQMGVSLVRLSKDYDCAANTIKKVII